MNYLKWTKTFFVFEFLSLFFITLILKFILAYYLPLLPDEAYYWVWSKHLQLSYFDHPAMIAWLFKLGHFLEPYGHAVRWPAVFINHLSYIFWFLIFIELKLSTKEYYSWLVLTFVSPILGFGSILMTPDLPVMLFWSASLYFFIRILNHKDLYNYALLGASLGLGFVSKYHIVLFPLMGLIYLSTQKKWQQIRLGGVALTFIFGFIFSLPVVVWNFQNDFQSFTFQLKHGLHSDQWKWQWPVEYVIGHYLLLIPMFVTAFYKKTLPYPQSILKYLSAGILIFFLLTSFRSSVEMNWTILAFPSFYAVIILSDISKMWLRSIKIFFLGFTLIVTGLMFNGIYAHGKIFEPFFFEKNKNLVEEFKPLYGINYQIASSLSYFNKIEVPKLPRASRYDFFDTFPIDYAHFPKEFYVFKEATNDYPEWLLDMKPTAKVVKKLERNYVVEKVTIK